MKLACLPDDRCDIPRPANGRRKARIVLCGKGRVRTQNLGDTEPCSLPTALGAWCNNEKRIVAICSNDFITSKNKGGTNGRDEVITSETKRSNGSNFK